MIGWYELNPTKNGQYHFVLKASNGEVILQSETYTTKAAAQNGIASVQANCELDERYERKTASNGKFHFNLKAATHQIIGSSQMSESERSRDAGIESVKKNGPSTIVKEGD